MCQKEIELRQSERQSQQSWPTTSWFELSIRKQRCTHTENCSLTNVKRTTNSSDDRQQQSWKVQGHPRHTYLQLTGMTALDETSHISTLAADLDSSERDIFWKHYTNTMSLDITAWIFLIYFYCKLVLLQYINGIKWTLMLMKNKRSLLLPLYLWMLYKCLLTLMFC